MLPMPTQSLFKMPLRKFYYNIISKSSYRVAYVQYNKMIYRLIKNVIMYFLKKVQNPFSKNGT